MNLFRECVKSVSWLTVAALVIFINCCFLQAAPQYASGSFGWDDGITPAWSDGSGGPYNLVWTNGNDAVFEGGAGTVDIAPAGVSARNLTFDTAGFIVRSNTLTLSGSPLFTANADAAISAAIAGTAGITKAGTAGLVLSGTNVYSGATSITAGMLQIGDGTANPALNAATYTIADGTTLRLFTDGAWDVTGQQGFFANLLGSGTLRLSSTAKVDWPGSGAQYYANFGGGFNGNVVIDRGRLPSNNGGMGGITSVTVNDGGQFASWNGATFSHNLTIAGYYGDEAAHPYALRTANPGSISTYNGTITLAASTAIGAQGTAYLNGVIDGAAGADLTCSANNSAGTIIMSAENTYAGSTTVKDGLTLQLGNGGTSGSLATSEPVNIETDNSGLKFRRSDTVTQGTDFPGITGRGSVIQSGSGTLVLNVANGGGRTVVEAGTMKLVQPAPQAYRYYRFHVMANYSNDAYNQVSELHFYSNGVWTAASGGSPANGGENNYANANDNNRNTKFGQAGVPYDLTYDFGTPHYFDSYNWSSANDRTPNRNPIRWIVYGSNDQSTWVILSDMTSWGRVGPTTTFTWSGWNAANYLSVVNGDPVGGLANAYPLHMLPLGTQVEVVKGATLDFNGSESMIGSLSDSAFGVGGLVTNSAASTPVTLTVNQIVDTFFSGVIADNGTANAVSLVKCGDGTLSLAGDNAYTGPTVIEDGTLKVGAIPGYRYYKFQVNSVYGGGGNGLQYSEMDFYSSGTNHTDGNRVFPVTATGDGGSYKDQGIPGLYDGSLNTKSFMDPPFPRYVIYDFGSPMTFTGYDWASANDSTPARNPNDWEILGSNDGVTWATLDTRTGAGATPTTTFTYAGGWALPSYAPPAGNLSPASPVQIASGATLDLGDSSQSVAELGGSGLVSNGTIIVSGSIMPGGADSVGTLTLAATAISGSLLADVNTDGSSDLLAVQGNLDLAGLSISVANPALLSAGHDYTLITCTGTRTGTIASLTAPSGWYVQYAPDGSVQLVYSGGSLILIQ